jgi:hypothetical protein
VIRALLAMCMLLPLLLGATDTYNVTFKWTSPTVGSPVQHYVVQLMTYGGQWSTIGSAPDTTYTVPCVVGSINFVRVAGVDALGRQGLFSDSSAPVDLRTTGVPMDDWKDGADVAIAKSSGCFRGR